MYVPSLVNFYFSDSSTDASNRALVLQKAYKPVIFCKLLAMIRKVLKIKRTTNIV